MKSGDMTKSVQFTPTELVARLPVEALLVLTTDAKVVRRPRIYAHHRQTGPAYLYWGHLYWGHISIIYNCSISMRTGLAMRDGRNTWTTLSYYFSIIEM